MALFIILYKVVSSESGESESGESESPESGESESESESGDEILKESSLTVLFSAQPSLKNVSFF